MFIFGHIGLTIGLILLGLMVFKRTDLLNKLDFRVIAIFAVLPDIIDKIIGHVVFHGALNNGRLFSHTLLFLGIFIIVFYIIVRSNWWVFALPIATHQMFDLTWEVPKTLAWPSYGWSFDKYEGNVLEAWYHALFNNPYIIISECLGIIVVIIIFIYFRLYDRGNLLTMLRTGRLKVR